MTSDQAIHLLDRDEAFTLGLAFLRQDLPLPVDLEMHLNHLGIDPDSITAGDTPPMTFGALTARLQDIRRQPPRPLPASLKAIMKAPKVAQIVGKRGPIRGLPRAPR